MSPAAWCVSILMDEQVRSKSLLNNSMEQFFRKNDYEAAVLYELHLVCEEKITTLQRLWKKHKEISGQRKSTTRARNDTT